MNPVPEILQFLGRFHVVLVHLPIGFLLFLAGAELLATRPRFRDASAAASYVLALAVPAAVVSAACGWLLALEGGYDDRLLFLHRWLGVATALLVVLTAILHRRGHRPAYRLALAVTTGTLILAGHFGGSLTHGRSYLTEHAPAPLRTLLGHSGTGAPPADSGEVADRNVFTGVVQPILNAHCTECHGPEKQKGHLRLDSITAVLQGGDEAVVVSGRSAESELIRRITLPLDDDDHMPPEGKSQPTPDAIAVLRWWVDVGAPADKTVRDLKPSEGVFQGIKRAAESEN